MPARWAPKANEGQHHASAHGMMAPRGQPICAVPAEARRLSHEENDVVGVRVFARSSAHQAVAKRHVVAQLSVLAIFKWPHLAGSPG